jgi:iron complex outermembrane receptor protein
MAMKPKTGLACGAVLAAVLAAAEPAMAQQRTFDVPAQEAASAISLFARQAGLQVVAPADRLQGVRTPALKGALDARAALHRLIDGAGLEIASDAGGVIVLRFSQPGAAAARSPTALDSVVVTVQKRDEAAQGVPVSLTAFGAATIEAQRLESLRDISRLTPGLLVSAFNHSSPTIAIRGATNTFTQIGANKPVAVVLDDLFIPRNSAATFELYGLNSIQVLKGPQGTLFGRNVTGGAIVLDSGKPAFDATTTRLRGGIGDFGLRQLDAVSDFAVGEAAALRFAASFKNHEGYGRDRLTGREQDDLDSRSLRTQLRLAPTDTLEVLVGADYADDQNGGRTLSSKAAGSNDGDRRTSELGYPQGFARNQWGASVRGYWDAPAGTVTSITGYRASQSGETYSGVGASYVFLTGTNTQAVNRDVDEVGLLSQELRYASPKWGWGDFVAGVYLSSENARRWLTTQTLAAVTGIATTSVLSAQKVDTKSYAGFVDGVIHLPASLDLTLGARYTHDEKTASLTRTDQLRPVNTFSASGLSADWGEVTPRAVLTWWPTGDMTVYGSVTRGYTAGGFNTDAATTAILTKPFNPEKVTNYELGLKSEWLENRLRINLSAFHMDYIDKQELYFDNATRILTINNAARATVDGVEAEVAWRPVRWLGLTATWGLLDTAYDHFVIPGGVTNTGNPLGSSPRNRASLASDLRAPLANGGYVIGAASYAHTDGYYTGATKDPNLHIEGYNLANASIGYEAADGRWTITAWVKNLADVDYVLTPSTQGVLAEYLGEPRTVGLMLAGRF